MIQSKDLINLFENLGVDLFTGVPDSLMESFCHNISKHPNHAPSVNEAAAVSLCIGHYMASGMPGLVYMQNSGLGNAHNPLVSLASKDVYGIPMILLIGHRGSADDEPQHLHQGRITRQHLELLDIPVIDLINYNDAEKAFRQCQLEGKPVALLVQKHVFELCDTPQELLHTSREDFIREFVKHIPTDSPIVATTGKTGRELAELNVSNPVFLTVGGMGCANMIAQGIARNTQKTVYILDGDGAIQMHLGNLINISCSNIVHVVIKNGCHQSVGGQPISDPDFNFVAHATNCGYSVAKTIDVNNIGDELRTAINTSGPILLEIYVSGVSRDNLSRPSHTPLENRMEFMNKL